MWRLLTSLTQKRNLPVITFLIIVLHSSVTAHSAGQLAERVLREVASMRVATGEVAVPPDPTPDIPPGEAIAVTAEVTYTHACWFACECQEHICLQSSSVISAMSMHTDTDAQLAT